MLESTSSQFAYRRHSVGYFHRPDLLNSDMLHPDPLRTELRESGRPRAASRRARRAFGGRQWVAFSGLACLIVGMIFSACADAPASAHAARRSQLAATEASSRAQLALPQPAQNDGEYTAEVSTWTGSYHGPVTVSDGKVVSIYWPKWGHVSVTGGKLTGDFAEAVTAHGEMVEIELISPL